MNTPGRYSPHQSVAPEHRVFGGRDMFSLWFSLGVGLMVLQLGALLAPGLGIPLLLILLDESENAFADIHSAAVSVGILLPLKVEYLALAIGAICTLIAWFAPLAEYQNFLLLIGSVFAPLFGVVLVDHYILRRRGRLAAPAAGLRWETLLAWGCGAATYHVLASAWPEIGASLPALFLSGGLLLVLSRVGRVTADTPVSISR